jgi:hypothetical protein
MSDIAGENPLLGRLARAVEAIRDEQTPVAPLERALSRARAIEPRSTKATANGRTELWRNRISSLFDQLEDRDLLTAAAVCCVAPADPPVSTESTVRSDTAVPGNRQRGHQVLEPTTCLAGEQAWTEALDGLWEEEEPLAVGAQGADWVATSTACADWTWSG